MVILSPGAETHAAKFGKLVMERRQRIKCGDSSAIGTQYISVIVKYWGLRARNAIR
jgi:hypothetical protein